MINQVQEWETQEAQRFFASAARLDQEADRWAETARECGEFAPELAQGFLDLAENTHKRASACRAHARDCTSRAAKA